MAVEPKHISLAKTLIGRGEVPDRDVLSEYMRNGGQNLDPATTAWCAAFVNATLNQSGMKGTGKLTARSYLDWGEPVDEPQIGDIAVFSRGDPNGWQGHVGFYQGINDDGSINVLGGNQSDSVNVQAYGADRLLGYRRGAMKVADLKFDPEKYEAFKAGPRKESAPAPDAGGFSAERYEAYKARSKPEAELALKPVDEGESKTSAFDAYMTKYHPDATPERREAIRQDFLASTEATVNNMLPFTDELAAGVAAPIKAGMALFTDKDASISGEYGEALEFGRMRNAAISELQGYADEIAAAGLGLFTGAGIASGVKNAAQHGGKVANIVQRATTAATTGGRYAKGAATGATVGAAHGFAAGEGEDDRLGNAALGAGTGLAGGIVGTSLGQLVESAARRFGPTVRRILGREGAITPEGGISPRAEMQLRSAGVDPDEVTAEFAEAFAKRAGDMQDDQAARAATLDSLSIPGTRGQLTGDVTQQAAEQGMRAGSRGGQGAANVMRQFDETQAGAVDAARDAIGSRMGGGRTLANDALEASGRALQGVQRKADEAKAAAQVFYKKSEEAGVRIAPQAFNDLVVRIEDRLASAEVIVDSATPMASRMLKVLQNRTIKPDGATGGVSLKLVDTTRSRISGALRDARRSGNTAETEALSEILSGMDEWIDDAVEGALYQGDKAGLESLKAARKLWTDYRKQFFGKSGADRFVAKMVEDEASPRDVFAWLYSNGRMGANRQSVQYATKLKDILGEGSDEWAALRQGAWAKLTQGTGDARRPGYQKVGEDIVEFVTGETRQLARTMFSPQEIREMLVYARAMRTLTPQRMATNPSGSGYEAGRMGQVALRRLSEMIGFSLGGVEGAIAGGAGGRMLTSGGGWLRARAAAAGIQPRQSVIPSAVGGNVAAGAVEHEDMMRGLRYAR